MRSIVFFSTATAVMTEQDLELLGRACAVNDLHVGVTGMLLHKNGSFLQAIEGSDSVISDLWARIVADPRHTDVRAIRDCSITEREFKGSTVVFRNLDGVPPDTPFLNPFSYDAFAADPALALLMLAYFYSHQ
jgi:hypothetical protein